MLVTLRRTIRRFPFLSLVRYLTGQIEYRLGLRRHQSGATHSRFFANTGESANYITRVGDDYLKYAGVTDDYLVGKNILEIGPGDNLGVALYFLAKGAETVTCIDRFNP